MRVSSYKFIIDGINLSKKEDLIIHDIVESEKDFIERLRELIKQGNKCPTIYLINL